MQLIAGKSRLKETVAKSTIEKTVKEQVKDFVDDWKTANPKN
jgi:hypothetical protein